MNCLICGAKRPEDEIKNKACANCMDLRAREELAKHKAENDAAAAAQAEKGQEALKMLPDLDKAASSLYDNERGVWWLGINLKLKDANPVGYLSIVDQAKGAMLQALADWKERERRRESLIVRVSGSVGGQMNKAKQNLKNLFAIKS